MSSRRLRCCSERPKRSCLRSVKSFASVAKRVGPSSARRASRKRAVSGALGNVSAAGCQFAAGWCGIALPVVVAGEVEREHGGHERAREHDRERAPRAQQRQEDQHRDGRQDPEPAQQDVRLDDERDDRRPATATQPRRRARAGPAEGDPGERREREREQRERAHRLVRRDRAQRPERMREEAGEPGRPQDRHDRERQRHARRAPAAHDRVDGERRHERARVERRELARVRSRTRRTRGWRRPSASSPTPAGSLTPVDARREPHELEPRQQRDGGETERRDARAGEDHEAAHGATGARARPARRWRRRA